MALTDLEITVIFKFYLLWRRHIGLLAVALVVAACESTFSASEESLAPAATEVSSPRSTAVPTLTTAFAATEAGSPSPQHTLSEYPRALVENSGALPERALYRFGIGYVNSLDVSPDGDKVVLSTSTGLYVYQLDEFRLLWRRITQDVPQTAEWSPNGDRIVSGAGINGPPELWDAETGFKLRRLEGWHRPVWSPDGTMIAVEMKPSFDSSGPTGLRIYSGVEGSLLRTLEIDIHAFYGWTMGEIEWMPDGASIAATTWDGKVVQWETDSWSRVRSLEFEQCGQRGIQQIAFAADSSKMFLVECYEGGDVILLDLGTGEQEVLLDEMFAHNISLSPDGMRLAVVTRDELAVYDWNSGEMLFRVFLEPSGSYFGMWSPNGEFVLATNSSSAKVFDASDGSLLLEIPRDNEWFSNLAIDWQPDSEALLMAHEQHVILWDVDKSMPTSGLGTFLIATDIAWTPDGRIAVLKGIDEYEYFDVETGFLLEEPPKDLRSEALFVNDNDEFSALSPDHTFNAVYEYQGECGDGPWGGGCVRTGGRVSIHNVSTDATVAVIDFPFSGISSLGWSPDGKVLSVGRGGVGMIGDTGLGASGLLGNEVVLISPFTREELARLEGHSGNVRALAFSPFGGLLASASSDGTVIIWDVTDIVR